MTTFINLYSTLEQAMYSRESQLTRHFTFDGIQLLPESIYPYVQTTSNPDGVELEDWMVEAYSLCGTLLGDISDNFTVERVFFDDLGIAQIDWSLRDLPDFDYQLIYLKIGQLAGQDYYTNPFMITAFESDKTARLDYRELSTDTMQSIQLQTWFRQYVNEDELTTYYETSTKNTVTKELKKATLELWFTEIMNNNLFLQFRNALYSRQLYIDLARCYPTEAIEIPELEASENFGELNYRLSFNRNDIFDPNFVIPIPVPPQSIEVLVQGRARQEVETSIFRYSVRMVFPFLPNTPVFNQAFSYVQINGDTRPFGQAFSSETSTTIFGSPTEMFIVPQQVNLFSFLIRMSGEFGISDYLYDGGEVIFTQSDIANGIEKTITASIV